MNHARGVTLIDTVVGISLMLLIFLGIFAAFQLSIDVVMNNKARSGAIALANERMEYIRSLSYTSVGTVGGIPSGTLAQTESISMNGISYTRRTLVLYVDDPKDGSAGSDTTGVADYKAVKVEISWIARTGTRSVYLVSRLEPATGLESAVSGGTLTINVLNASDQPISNAQVHIVNTSSSPTVDLTTYTNTDGTISLVGAPAASNYSVVVTKSGYSTAQTYSSTAQNPNPSPGNLTVTNNQTTVGTFAIDVLSNMTVNTYSFSTGTWSDSFANESKLGDSTTNIEISGNRARFAGNQPWTLPADLYSEVITPAGLSQWGTFSWNDTQPAETIITYHVYYPSGSSEVLVPDSVLPGNSAGFSSGTSIDLGSIPAATYPSLVLNAYLVALNPSAPSPSVEDWDVTYDSAQGVSVAFTMRGAKIIGTGSTIYKYDQLLTTNSSGTLSIPNLEWDTYSMSVNASTGYDIASSCAPQPVVLSPGSSVTTSLYLVPHTESSLPVKVAATANGALIAGASVRLYAGGYDETQTTDSCGQTFFSGLSSGPYSLSVSASGYTTFNNANVSVGTTTPVYSVSLN